MQIMLESSDKRKWLALILHYQTSKLHSSFRDKAYSSSCSVSMASLPEVAWFDLDAESLLGFSVNTHVGWSKEQLGPTAQFPVRTYDLHRLFTCENSWKRIKERNHSHEYPADFRLKFLGPVSKYGRVEGK